MSITSASIGKMVSFQTYASPILGSIYKKLEVTGIIGYDMARRLDDVDGIHISIFPNLPAGTPASPRLYSYVTLYDIVNKKTIVMGLPWINQSTIEESDLESATVTVFGLSQPDIARLGEVLRVNGFNDVLINVGS